MNMLSAATFLFNLWTPFLLFGHDIPIKAMIWDGFCFYFFLGDQVPEESFYCYFKDELGQIQPRSIFL